ncbi:MAG: response regulator [Bryobacterales bacterium]|nr:response regulator [Bryobacterales bacterium]
MQAPALTRVLIIDDEEAARHGIRRSLASQGYALDEAADGIAALDKIRVFEPDVIVSDISMPGMDGITLLRQIGREAESPLVVFLTAHGSEEVAIEALRAGAYDFLTKPFEVEVLRTTVRNAVERHRMAGEIRGYCRQLEQTVRELKEAQAARVQAEKMAALGRLVAGVAHEINSPLGALASSLDTVERLAHRIGGDPGNTELASMLADSAAQPRIACERISSVVQRLKEFAQLDRSDRQKLRIRECITSTVSLLDSQLEGIDVVTTFEDTAEIECERRQINDLFLNLLLNAVDAIRKKGGPGLLTIRSTSGNGEVVAEVGDNGCGIPEDHLAHIFDPGFTTKGVRVGVGWGLPICYQIARAHNGRLSVTSHPGEGCLFTLTLPAV